MPRPQPGSPTLRMRTIAIERSPTTIFASIPCTGGTLWNSVSKNNPNGEAKIEEHRRLFDKIWDNFVKLVKFCDANTTNIPVGVVIEWPKGCTYWRNAKVIAFMEFRGMLQVSFDGCYFGLQSSDNHLPIRKPWTFATCNPAIYVAFQGCKCPGHTHHQQCEGAHTKATESYIVAMVSKLHRAISKSAFKLQNRTKGAYAFPAIEGSNFASIPAMPCQTVAPKHRIKVTHSIYPFVSMVARPVPKKEILTNPKAKASVDAEWEKLRKKHMG